MRAALQETAPIILDGRVIGVNLGFDFAAEHEWGFKWANRYLGRPDAPTSKLLGVAARTTTAVKEFGLQTTEALGALWLRGEPSWKAKYGSLEQALQPGEGSHNMATLARMIGGRDLVAGWNTDDGFCIGGKSDEARAAIRAAHDALVGNRCFIIQSGGVFGAGGLKLIDAAEVPPEVDAELIAADLARLSLTEAVEATGIRDRLEAAGLRYFALSPRWEDQAKGKFKFWLNPMEQHSNNAGWFSLADLDAWIAGKGPVPKRQRATA